MTNTKNNDDSFENSSLSPTIASSFANDGRANDSSSGNQNSDVQAARRGLLKAIWQTAFAPRFSSRPIDLQTTNPNSSASPFSSKPIDMEEYFLSNRTGGGSFVRQNSCVTVGTTGTGGDNSFSGSRRPNEFQNSLQESSLLTPSERGYLQGLLQSEDTESIRRASARLSDKEIFPSATDSDDEEAEATNEGSLDEAPQTTKRKSMPLPPTSTPPRRRDSQVQEQLLEWHEKTTIMPSVVLQRMSSNQSAKKVATIQPRTIPPNNSLTQDDTQESSLDYPFPSSDEMEDEKEGNDCTIEQERVGTNDNCNQNEKTGKLGDTNDVPVNEQSWNSELPDLNTWMSRTEGVEVDEEGYPSETANMTSNPFKILGTSADDVSVQPMVLSPPLMEGLQNFMPESLQEHHYWLKYSMVRDGPGLMKLLRHCRGSQHTILAIESTDGYVFGSFTSQPWRMTSPSKGTNQYYGSKESFVWRMRQSRFEPCESVVEQILMESKMDVFPFTSRNNRVQSCTKNGISLGHGEIKEEVDAEEIERDESSTKSNPEDCHYGHAITLDKTMATGFTSSSETFGNPCLIERESRGKKFVVANVELWTMTPHESVENADHAEMRALFLEENRQTDKNLNLIEILVGNHKSQKVTVAFQYSLEAGVEVEPESYQTSVQYPWKRAIIDYSGANEYIEAHYGRHPSLQSDSWTNASVSYFSSGGVRGDRAEEDIYDARELMAKTKSISSNTSCSSLYHRRFMESYGMTLLNAPTSVTEWRNEREIEDIYTKELEDMLPSLFSSKIMMHCFWNPMLRGENLEVSSPRSQQVDNVDRVEGKHSVSISTANVAPAVHIDTDVGAYASLDEFLAIVEKNRVIGQREGDEASFDREWCKTCITMDRKRFAVVNFWRNTNRNVPVTKRPLAVLSTRYSVVDSGSIANRSLPAFPYCRPDMEQSKWYTYPNMTNDEVLVFYQYDRLVTQPSDLWHCAVSIDDDRAPENNEYIGITSLSDNAEQLTTTRMHPPRESFDIRALIVFDEKVPPDKDRYHSERLRPVLTFEESGCFCDEQASLRT